MSYLFLKLLEMSEVVCIIIEGFKSSGEGKNDKICRKSKNYCTNTFSIVLVSHVYQQLFQYTETKGFTLSYWVGEGRTPCKHISQCCKLKYRSL